MRICVSLRDPAPANLKEGNLRSEGRWERQVLEAVLENDRVTEVYTVGPGWAGNHRKYKGGMKANIANSTVLLAQDWNYNNIRKFRFKAVIVNIFSGPWVEQIKEVKKYAANIGKKLFFTMGFPVMHRNELGLENWHEGMRMAEGNSHLEKFLPRNHILLLPVPGAPYVTKDSNFDKKKILWAQRLVFMSQMGTSPTLLWSLQQLEKDPSLSLDVLTGWKLDEVKDHVDGNVVYHSSIKKAFWNLEAFAPFGDSVRNRVRIHLERSWEQVLQMYSEAKIFSTHGRLFGGPPIEAGLHGIPFVGSGKTGALCDCPVYLHANIEGPTGNEEDLGGVDILDKLLNDRDYYTEIGNAYRDYVEEHYTYAAFNRNLNKILTDRGLL